MDLKKVFLSLKPGDLLRWRSHIGDISRCVLATGEDGQGFFVLLSRRNDLYLPWGCNPLRWSEERGGIIDSDDDVLNGFSSDLELERGACFEAVEKYKTLPRIENVPKRFTEAEVIAYARSPEGNALGQQLRLIFQNNEVKAGVDEVSLVLHSLGIDVTLRNIAGIVNCVETLATRFATQNPMVAVSIVSGSPAQAGEPPSRH